jgi:hypothetical protein
MTKHADGVRQKKSLTYASVKHTEPMPVHYVVDSCDDETLVLGKKEQNREEGGSRVEKCQTCRKFRVVIW